MNGLMTTASGRLHVGFVLYRLTGGGAERTALTLAESLVERGHRVDLLVARLIVAYREDLRPGMRLYHPRLPRTDRELLRHCRERGVEVHAVPIDPLAAIRTWFALTRKRLGTSVRPRYALFAHLIARYVRRARPQVLMSVLQPADTSTVYAAELTGRPVPVVVSVRNSPDTMYTRQELSEARALFPRADAVVAVSRGLADELRRSFDMPAEHVQAIYNPVPSATIWRLARREVTHPWFRDGAPPVVLSIGREAPQKDYATLVDAFGRVRRRVDARLVVMGNLSASCRAHLTARARGCGVERHLGFVDFDENPFRYLRRARLFVLSSRSEGLPGVLLQAIACGTPVVSTDTPHGPREILEGGRYGKLTPVGDAPALARAVVEALECDRPPEEALRRRAAWFSCERAADAHVELFREVLSRHER